MSKNSPLECEVCGEDTMGKPWIGLHEWAIGDAGCAWLSKGFGPRQPGKLGEAQDAAEAPEVVVACWPVCATMLLDGKFAELNVLAREDRS